MKKRIIQDVRLKMFFHLTLVLIFFQLFVFSTNVNGFDDISFEIKDISMTFENRFAFIIKNTGNVAIEIKHQNAIYSDSSSQPYGWIRYRYENSNFKSLQIPITNVIIEPNEEKQIINEYQFKIFRDFTLEIVVRDLGDNILISKEKHFKWSEIENERADERYEIEQESLNELYDFYKSTFYIFIVLIFFVILTYFFKKKNIKKKDLEKERKEIIDMINKTTDRTHDSVKKSIRTSYRFCNECNAELEDNHKFCPICGFKYE